MKISLKEQVSALEDTVNNHRTYINWVTRFVEEGKRPLDILEDTQKRLPYMEACLATMQWLLRNEEKIKEALKK